MVLQKIVSKFELSKIFAWGITDIACAQVHSIGKQTSPVNLKTSLSCFLNTEAINKKRGISNVYVFLDNASLDFFYRNRKFFEKVSVRLVPNPPTYQARTSIRTERHPSGFKISFSRDSGQTSPFGRWASTFCKRRYIRVEARIRNRAIATSRNWKRTSSLKLKIWMETGNYTVRKYR